MLPIIVTQARADRAFLGRAVRYLAGEAGIRQFLDIGTGLPTADNTHEVAQRVAPERRIVYVDNDPLVLSHARALLTSAGGCLQLRRRRPARPDKILSEAARTLDFTQPVALLLDRRPSPNPDTTRRRRSSRRLMDGYCRRAASWPSTTRDRAVSGAAMEEAVRALERVGHAER